MRFFKVTEITESEFLDNAGGYDDRFDVETNKGQDGAVYVYIDDEREDEFEICLDQFEEV